MQTLRKIQKKLSSKRGFTMIELLTALFIVTLMTTMISVGVSVGLKVQMEATFVANSDMLSSTLNTAMSDVLRYSEVDALANTPADPHKLYIRNEEYGINDGYLFLSDKGRLGVHVEKDEASDVRYFLGDGAYTSVKLKDFKLEYDETKKLFKGSYTVIDTKGSGLTKPVEFVYRTVANT